MGLFSKLFGSGNKSAYDTSGVSSAVNQSNQLLKDMYDKAVASGQPWLDLGKNAAGELGDRLSALTTPFDFNTYTSDPSYQFLQDEAQKTIERSAAAKGNVYAPSTLKALQDRSQSLASSEYGNAFNRDLASKSSIYDMLMGISNTGQTQANQNALYGLDYADAVSGNNIGLQNAILGSYQAKNANGQSALGNWINLGGRALSGWLGRG